MKLFQLFGKTPSYKKFNFAPRFYNPEEEERREREERIRRELMAKGQEYELPDESQMRRQRISGSFRNAKKTATVQSDPSASMLRIIILLVLAVGLIGFLQFGMVALYGIVLLITPFYFYLKFRNIRKK